MDKSGFLASAVCFFKKKISWLNYLPIYLHNNRSPDHWNWNPILKPDCLVSPPHQSSHQTKQTNPTIKKKPAEMYESCTCNVSRLYLSFFTLYFLYNLSQLWLFVFNVLYTRCIRNVYCTNNKIWLFEPSCSCYFLSLTWPQNILIIQIKKIHENFWSLWDKIIVNIMLIRSNPMILFQQYNNLINILTRILQHYCQSILYYTIHVYCTKTRLGLLVICNICVD